MNTNDNNTKCETPSFIAAYLMANAEVNYWELKQEMDAVIAIVYARVSSHLIK